MCCYGIETYTACGHKIDGERVQVCDAQFWADERMVLLNADMKKATAEGKDFVIGADDERFLAFAKRLCRKYSCNVLTRKSVDRLCPDCAAWLETYRDCDAKTFVMGPLATNARIVSG